MHTDFDEGWAEFDEALAQPAGQFGLALGHPHLCHARLPVGPLAADQPQLDEEDYRKAPNLE